MRILWTALALEDLKIISARIERQRNLTSANRVCRAIYNTVQVLRRFPESGKPALKSEPASLSFQHCPTSLPIAYWDLEP
jgi:plasmid stabilization system protein ParE